MCSFFLFECVDNQIFYTLRSTTHNHDIWTHFVYQLGSFWNSFVDIGSILLTLTTFANIGPLKLTLDDFCPIWFKLNQFGTLFFLYQFCLLVISLSHFWSVYFFFGGGDLGLVLNIWTVTEKATTRYDQFICLFHTNVFNHRVTEDNKSRVIPAIIESRSTGYI